MVAILDPDAIPAVRLTVDEYLQADLPEGFHYELVDGVVEMSPNPGGLHEQIIYALNKLLVEHTGTHPASIALVSFNSNLPIPGTERVREPDVAVYARWEARRRGFTAWREFTPILVVEVVSPGQEHRDYHEKRDDYWKAGVSEYWIVDPDKATITVLARGTDSWREEAYSANQSFAARSLPGLSVNVREILSSP